MEILKDILITLEKGIPVENISRGPLWTGVVSRGCGLASAIYEGECESAEGKAMHDPAPWIKMTADECAALSLSEKKHEASLGLAAINSLIDVSPDDGEEINASEFIIRAGTEKNVSIIGHFPFVDTIRAAARNLWVIEKRLRPGDYPETDAEKYLPVSDVIAISSTTLINHTLSSILELCPSSSTTILLGPTTPLSEVLFDYGINLVSGSRVTDISLVLESIRRGISFSRMKKEGGIKLVNLIRDRSAFRKLMSS